MDNELMLYPDVQTLTEREAADIVLQFSEKKAALEELAKKAENAKKSADKANKAVQALRSRG